MGEFRNVEDARRFAEDAERLDSRSENDYSVETPPPAMIGPPMRASGGH